MVHSTTQRILPSPLPCGLARFERRRRHASAVGKATVRAISTSRRLATARGHPSLLATLPLALALVTTFLQSRTFWSVATCYSAGTLKAEFPSESLAASAPTWALIVLQHALGDRVR
jgi:hypothetical protein